MRLKFLRNLALCALASGAVGAMLGALFNEPIALRRFELDLVPDAATQNDTLAVGTALPMRSAVRIDRDLRPPSLPDPDPVPAYAADLDGGDPRQALAWQYDAPIFAEPRRTATVTGIARRNTRQPIARRVRGHGCRRSWYQLESGAYVCASDGFSVASKPAPLPKSLRVRPPDVQEYLPYAYAKVITPGAPMYAGVPTPIEEQQAIGSTSTRKPVRERLDGVRFVAVDRSVGKPERGLVRTIRGFVVAAADLRPVEPPKLVGEHLDGSGLPLGFVYVDEAEVLDPDDGTAVGRAYKHARFAVQAEAEVAGRPVVVVDADAAVPRDAVRVASLVRRPSEIPPDARWVHVDLSEQTLVAYEADEPVFATLVSTGKPGYEPPLGVFRIRAKYISKTMAGDDPIDGYYEIEDVPWTMYYWGSFAVHGAYWHDTFGRVRSHGCTNMAPADARWLFYWADPELPAGWHGRVLPLGTWLYYTA